MSQQTQQLQFSTTAATSTATTTIAANAIYRRYCDGKEGRRNVISFLPGTIGKECTAAQVGSFSTQFCQKRRPLDHSIICCIHLMCDVFFCATGCPTCASLLRQEWLYLSMINAFAAQRSGIEDCAYFHTDLWKQWKFEACLKLVVLSSRSSYVFLTLREAHTAMRPNETNLRPKGSGRKLVGQGGMCIERIYGATF